MGPKTNAAGATSTHVNGGGYLGVCSLKNFQKRLPYDLTTREGQFAFQKKKMATWAVTGRKKNENDTQPLLIMRKNTVP